MRWLTSYRVRNYFRRSAWIVPSAAIPVTLVVGPITRRIDEALGWGGMHYTRDAAKSLVDALAPAALTFIVLILSTLLLSIQLASSQLSPRLISGLLARRPVKICLAVFVFTYVYCTGTSARIGDRVPQLCVVIAIYATLVSVVAGLFLIDYMAKELRPVQMLARTAGVGRNVIEQVYPELVSVAAPPDPPINRDLILPEPFETIFHTGRSGVFLAMDVKGLLTEAQHAGGAIEVIPEVGDFVARGDPLFRVHPGRNAVNARWLCESVAFGDERTAEQDPTFVFRILVDVAAKALSPAVNDPTTAVLAIDQIHHLLRQVGTRRLDTGEVRDAAGNLRLVYRTPDWEDFVLLAVTEIRQYGAQSIQVMRRLHAMLENLRSVLPRQRGELLEEQSRLLHAAVQRGFNDPEDRARAEIADLQGVGGSVDDVSFVPQRRVPLGPTSTSSV
jgi:uncharacterized membrane protein